MSAPQRSRLGLTTFSLARYLGLRRPRREGSRPACGVRTGARLTGRLARRPDCAAYSAAAILAPGISGILALQSAFIRPLLTCHDSLLPGTRGGLRSWYIRMPWRSRSHSGGARLHAGCRKLPRCRSTLWTLRRPFNRQVAWQVWDFRMPKLMAWTYSIGFPVFSAGARHTSNDVGICLALAHCLRPCGPSEGHRSLSARSVLIRTVWWLHRFKASGYLFRRMGTSGRRLDVLDTSA